VITNVTEVLAGEDLTPTLGIRLLSPRQFELRLSGVTNVAYEVQASADLETWTTTMNVPGPEWKLLSSPPDISNRASLFNPARVAP
jgi:hypothetical protein